MLELLGFCMYRQFLPWFIGIAMLPLAAAFPIVNEYCGAAQPGFVAINIAIIGYYLLISSVIALWP